jgi:hypothetical protein
MQLNWKSIHSSIHRTLNPILDFFLKLTLTSNLIKKIHKIFQFINCLSKWKLQKLIYFHLAVKWRESKKKKVIGYKDKDKCVHVFQIEINFLFALQNKRKQCYCFLWWGLSGVDSQTIYSIVKWKEKVYSSHNLFTDNPRPFVCVKRW